MSDHSSERFKKEPHIKASWTEAHIHELQKQFFESLSYLEPSKAQKQKPRFIPPETVDSEGSTSGFESLSEERAKLYFDKISQKFEKYRKLSPSSACRINDIQHELKKEDFTFGGFISFLLEKEKRQKKGSDCYIEIEQLIEVLQNIDTEFKIHQMDSSKQQALTSAIEPLFMNQRTIDAKTFKCFERLKGIAEVKLVKKVVQYWAELHADALSQEAPILEQWLLNQLKLVNDP